jgi:hypothetical protein
MRPKVGRKSESIAKHDEDTALFKTPALNKKKKQCTSRINLYFVHKGAPSLSNI